MRAGASFLISGGRVGKPHLWLVLTDPEPPTGKVVIAMVVTSRPHTDKTVTLIRATTNLLFENPTLPTEKPALGLQTN